MPPNIQCTLILIAPTGTSTKIIFAEESDGGFEVFFIEHLKKTYYMVLISRPIFFLCSLMDQVTIKIAENRT